MSLIAELKILTKYLILGFRIWLSALPLFYFEVYMVITLAASTGEYKYT